MKSLVTVLLGIACLTLLFFGNLHWQEKIERAGATTVNKTQDIAKEISDKNDTNKQTLRYAMNWTEKEKQSLQTAITEDRPYHILIAGSMLLGQGDTSWPSLFKKEMTDAYGENVITVVTKSYSNTTEEFVKTGKQEEFIDESADLIIWEPFTLTDNSVVDIEDSLDNILTVINDVKAKNSHTIFILQPPSPVYQPKLYKRQVEALNAFAKEHQIPFLNHWTNWPDASSEEVLTYLYSGTSTPNEEGHRVWAEFLVDRFISN
jgi:hypothetical protein